MPTFPARKGFAPGTGGYVGWRDKVGHTFRPGPNVFVMAAYDKWGTLPPGKVPVRLFKSFHEPGDRFGKYRLQLVQ